LAVAYSFIGVIGAEFITSSRGIGYEISFAYNNFDNPVMYAMILFILLLVITVNISTRRTCAPRGHRACHFWT
jgi:NitT/TauT family transport system permease protein